MKARVWQTSLWVVPAAAMALWGCSRAAGAAGAANSAPEAPPVKTVGEQGPAGQALPGLTQAKAPAWVKLGLRLVYEVESATIEGIGPDWKEDENGIWKTEDGKRWTPSKKGANGGHGLLVCDVTALSNGVAVINATFYLEPLSGGAPSNKMSFPIIGRVGNAGGLWVNPAELKKAKNVNTPELKVMHMQYDVANGNKRAAVWIQASDSTSSLSYVYDEETGVLLHDGSSHKGKPQPVYAQEEGVNTPSVTLSDGKLVEQRVIAYPWAGEDATAWSATPSEMIYEGTITVPTAAGRPLILGLKLDAKPDSSGPGWIKYAGSMTTTNSMGMPPKTDYGSTVSGLGQFGASWLPPVSLGRLTQGQVLDNDPVTLVRVTVTSVSEDLVVLTAENPAQTLRWGYDRRTGLLKVVEREEHNAYAPIKAKVTLRN